MVWRLRHLPLKSEVVSSNPVVSRIFFANFYTFGVSGGSLRCLGFDIRPEMDNTRQPTAAMRPVYSYPLHKVIYALNRTTCGNPRKLVFSLYLFKLHTNKTEKVDYIKNPSWKLQKYQLTSLTIPVRT